MILNQGEIRPGKVLRVEDPYGTIKGSCRGIFAEKEDPDKLPPIVPFTRTSSTSFCQPHVGDEIWVMRFWDNPWELFYMFKGDVRKNNQDILDGEFDDIEVTMRRTNPEGENAMMLYTDRTGMIMANGNAIVQTDQNKNVHIEREGEHRTVEVNEDGISLGSPGKSEQPAVLGNACESAFKSIYRCLSALSTAAKENMNTAALAPVIDNILPEMRSWIEQIKSEHVTLD